MAYTPQTWTDKPATTTPLSAARLTVMEEGIEDAHTAADAATPTAYASLTDGATVTWATAGKFFPNAKVTLGGNRTLNITGAVNGQTGTLIVTQDGTGSRTLALPGLEEGGGLTLSTAAGAVDVLAYTYDGTTFYWTLGTGFA